MTFMIYGASGYTGRLCAEHAAERGLRPVLAGRRADAVRELAEALDLPWRALGLQPTPAEFDGVCAVLHAAGPFSATAQPMARACLRAGVHYVDITGEVDVFETLAGWDGEARAAGVMLLPGAGFDVVPSDCLAAHVAGRLPGATRLRLSVGGLSQASRGTTKTMVESLGAGLRVRRAGKILSGLPPVRATADFGAGPRRTVGVAWGDVSTAWRSTGIGDVEVFFEASPQVALAARLPGAARRVLALGPVRRFLQRQVDRRLPQGPSAEHRASARAAIVAQAWDATGRSVTSRLSMPEPYHLTARTAVETARLASEGQAVPGYQTPSLAYGADFILRFDGVERSDV